MELDLGTLTERLTESLRTLMGQTLTVTETRVLGGGSINTALLIRTTEGDFFAKYNDAVRYEGMFTAEARNLELLRQTRSLRVPHTVGQFVLEGKEFLVLEYMESGTPHYDFWRDFGTGLADLHKHTSAQFGLDYDNFIGSLRQSNTPHSSWVDFFVSQRLEPQLRMAVDKGKADESVVKKFEALYAKLPDIFPVEAPALVHGDLWSGNSMADFNGDPVIYDPAVYYGHREMDLAMSKLFGGFEEEFYEAYNDVFPLEKHWEQRMAVCNLYPLLVHVNLFVGSYIQSVKNIISRF